MIRVLLLEPDGWRYRGLCSVLRDSGECDVIGELDYSKILAMTTRPEDLAVDVIVVAHRLILEYGIAIVPVLRDIFEPCQIVVHSEVESLEVAAQVYAAGARGFFPLSSAPGQIVKAVTVVHLGKYWGPREAVALMAERVIEGRKEKETAPGEEDRHLLELLNEGLSNKEIGQRMGLAEATIKARFNRLYKRFGVATRLQLLSAAISQGLITPHGKAS